MQPTCTNRCYYLFSFFIINRVNAHLPDNGFWGEGGTEEEISAPYLQDTEERLYCDEIYPTYLPTFSPTNGPECDTVEDCIKLANEKEDEETATSSVNNSAVMSQQRQAVTLICNLICLVFGYYQL